MTQTKSLYILIIFLSLSFNLFAQDEEQIKKLPYSAFSFQIKAVLPGSPENIFDAATGDISGWWDHSFSKSPKAFYIEPKPGGGFYEIYDDKGNGVKHAAITVADRGKMLRFEGPLGLSGRAIQMVTTYTFEPSGKDSTLMKVEVHAAGEIEDQIPETVEKVWKHFLFERFKPYIESGKNIKKN